MKNTLELNLKGLGQAHSHFVSEAEKRFTEVYGWTAKREEREKTLWDQVSTLHRELGEIREAVHENAREGREQRRSEMDGIRNFLESQKNEIGGLGTRLELLEARLEELHKNLREEFSRVHAQGGEVAVLKQGLENLHMGVQRAEGAVGAAMEKTRELSEGWSGA